ncbi:hypothetical protein FA13DRAFT_1455769 [Coprinellus micaceus]|uniref:Uncharacterized protein n=1 Tax=Coprinellus micaceus TaxID=71717 RepID=A0A4Y7SMR6_COPMI|nr:hypothetical protein FA13DRAFT_1455769 [Coprinellus micaceus]
MISKCGAEWGMCTVPPPRGAMSVSLPSRSHSFATGRGGSLRAEGIPVAMRYAEDTRANEVAVPRGGWRMKFEGCSKATQERMRGREKGKREVSRCTEYILPPKSKTDCRLRCPHFIGTVRYPNGVQVPCRSNDWGSRLKESLYIKKEGGSKLRTSRRINSGRGP